MSRIKSEGVVTLAARAPGSEPTLALLIITGGKVSAGRPKASQYQAASTSELHAVELPCGRWAEEQIRRACAWNSSPRTGQRVCLQQCARLPNQLQVRAIAPDDEQDR